MLAIVASENASGFVLAPAMFAARCASLLLLLVELELLLLAEPDFLLPGFWHNWICSATGGVVLVAAGAVAVADRFLRSGVASHLTCGFNFSFETLFTSGCVPPSLLDVLLSGRACLGGVAGCASKCMLLLLKGLLVLLVILFDVLF